MDFFLRLLDYGIAGAVLFYVLIRVERRLDEVKTQLRILAFLMAEGHGVDRNRIDEIERLMNGSDTGNRGEQRGI